MPNWTKQSLVYANYYAVVDAPAMAATLIRAIEKQVSFAACMVDVADREAARQGVHATSVFPEGP